MPALFIDTTFGFLMRNISGGRLFKYEDQYNEELREEYFNSGEIKEEEASDDEEKNGSKGKYKLIEFRENDPDVRRSTIGQCVPELTRRRTRKTGPPSRSAS
jgi:DHA1 family multidrug resistance protein-like MFS transporter